MSIQMRAYFFFIMLLASTLGMAQMSGSFSMSPLASSTGNFTSNGGSPIVMSGTGKCLAVSSGLTTITINNNGKGVFGASCIETVPVATVLVSLTNLNVYPNPTHSTSILKCVGNFDANLFCQVRIISMEGRVMMSQMVLLKEVAAGYTINASAYAAGMYIVNVDFMNQQFNLKLIKL